MSREMEANRALLAGGLAVAVAVPVAFGIVQGVAAAAISAAWVLGAVAVLHYGRTRSDTVRTIGGAGDERTRALNVRALAFGGFVMWAVVTGWWLVSVIAGDENITAGVLAAVFALSYIGAALYQSRRG
jgi:hypothetical protein